MSPILLFSLQIGPGMVYLAPTVTMMGQMLLIMLVIPVETFKQRVVHVSLGPSNIFGKLRAVTALRIEGLMVSNGRPFLF